MVTVSYCAGVPLSGDGKSQPANALIGQLLCMGFGRPLASDALQRYRNAILRN